MKKNKKSAGIIYTVKCKVTAKYYVGSTSDSLEQRKLDHQERANRGEKHLFAQAIATHGAEAFIWTQTETANTTDELARKEKEYIEKLNSKKAGYNSDSGGGFKKTVYQYSTKNGSLLNMYDCLQGAADAVGVSPKTISKTCNRQNKTCKGYFWSYNFSVPFSPEKDLRKKEVIQYSLSGQRLAVFDSVAEASRLTGISKTCISRVCRGEREHSGGFSWKYVEIKNI